MAHQIMLGNFSAIQARARTVLSYSKTVPDPFKGATTISAFKQAVADGRRLLPTRYQARYVDVLDQVVRQAEQVLLGLRPRDLSGRKAVYEQLQEIFSVTAAPIVQLQSTAHRRELKAFLALISNVYGRFINDSLVQKGSKFNILSPDLDPLGSFGQDDHGPFTLPASQDMPVALVSKPGNQMGFLPFWAADGHEVGGHDIYGAVQGYEAELSAKLESNIRAAFASGRVKTSQAKVSIPYRGLFSRVRTMSMEDFMVRVWKAWLPEASSDHAGLANIGPMYLNSLILLLSCVRAGGTLSDSGVFDRKQFGAASGFEPHPIDVVRVLLCLEATKLLRFADGKAYAQALTDRLLVNLGGSLPASIAWNDQQGNRAIDLPLPDFQAVLPVVAETMLATKLAALSNQAFGDIVNWSDADEALVQAAALKLAAGDTSMPSGVEARHIVAASLVAMESASLKPKFSAAAASIHDTGIKVLKDLYDAHCLLCSIVSPSLPAATAPLVDVARLFKHVKSR